MSEFSCAARPANRLASEKSPYLRQHAHNPVDWFPWGDEAFARARAEDRPVFLSIGYSTCHWCHVMERESFENPAVADLLNRHFVSIKVDREERPDVDRIYMTFIQATTGQGGWPLNAFLTPDRKPFHGGTYFPPENRQGRPGLTTVLRQISQLWTGRRGEILRSADELHERLATLAAIGPAEAGPALTPAVLAAARARLKQDYDPQHGGFGGPPKFPRPSHPAFLLQAGRRWDDAEAVRMVLHTCARMAAGGLHDQLGGGFARYSVDERWRVPHFEKMLYDNAQLASLYLDAFLVSGDPQFADVARDVLDYVLRDLTQPEGGFYSAEDADSEGKEGKFYCWTRAEIVALLSPAESAVALRRFGVTATGNFVDHSDPEPLAGQNVLSVVDPQLASGEAALLASVREKLLAARNRRVRPLLDDKILSSWNGLMLGTLARAAAVLGEETYRAAAEKNLAFLHAKLWDPATRTLHHRWRGGERDAAQLLEAYAFLLAGVVELYETTLEARHLEFAVTLAEAMCARFEDREAGGFWQTPADAADLIIRIKESYDGAEPAGNSVACLALLKLAAICDRPDFRQSAERTLRLFSRRLGQAPEAVPHLLQALAFWIEPPRRVVIADDGDAVGRAALLRAAHGVFQPHKIVAGRAGPVEPWARSLPAPAGRATAYVCTGTACQAPTQEPAVLAARLAAPGVS